MILSGQLLFKQQNEKKTNWKINSSVLNHRLTFQLIIIIIVIVAIIVVMRRINFGNRVNTGWSRRWGHHRTAIHHNVWYKIWSKWNKLRSRALSHFTFFFIFIYFSYFELGWLRSCQFVLRCFQLVTFCVVADVVVVHFFSFYNSFIICRFFISTDYYFLNLSKCFNLTNLTKWAVASQNRDDLMRRWLLKCFSNKSNSKHNRWAHE